MSKEFRDKDSPETIARRKANAQLQKLFFRGKSNLQFSKEDQNFRNACEKAGVEPTMRQASKYRRKTGKAYNQGRK